MLPSPKIYILPLAGYIFLHDKLQSLVALHLAAARGKGQHNIENYRLQDGMVELDGEGSCGRMGTQACPTSTLSFASALGSTLSLNLYGPSDAMSYCVSGYLAENYATMLAHPIKISFVSQS